MKKIQRILLFFLLFGTMLIFGLIENIKGVSYPLIKLEFSASFEQLGLMVSILSAAYVSFSIIAGIFLGRFGIKPSFLFGYAALSLSLITVFFAPGFSSTAATLFLAFAGFGFFEVGVNALASRVFITRTALLMNLLHSFYGIGAIIGPKAAGIIVNSENLGWRYVYIFMLPLALILFIPALFTRFPESSAGISGESSSSHNNDNEKRKSFFDALKSPAVWLFSVTLGLAVIIEMNSANWGPMYFHDVYGIDPSTSGATFLSAFFLVFTVSRLICGPLVEKIGYMRTLLGISIIVLFIFCAGFIIGQRGIFILPALGFFIALLWPTLMAVAIHSFGKDAPVFSSAMIAIGGLINAIVQYLIGMTNKIFGPAWGYRSTLVYNVLLIIALVLLNRLIRKYPANKPLD